MGAASPAIPRFTARLKTDLPIEALMGALGACKCIVARSFAEQHGVELKSVEVSVEGEFDPDGFLGKNPEAKIGRFCR